MRHDCLHERRADPLAFGLGRDDELADRGLGHTRPVAAGTQRHKADNRAPELRDQHRVSGLVHRRDGGLDPSANGIDDCTLISPWRDAFTEAIGQCQ